MEEKRIPKRLLIIGNGFDLDLGRATRYSDFAKSEFWPKNLYSQLYEYLNQKSQIEKWFDLEGELAAYVQKAAKTIPAFRTLIPETAKKDAQDFKVIVSAMIAYLQSVQKKNVKSETLAAKVFSLVCQDSAFSKIYSFNYIEKRTITIFTYNEASRMEIMRTLHKMNHGRTSMLFQNNQLNIFCTYDKELEMSDAFREWYQYRLDEIERTQTKGFFEGITDEK